MADKLKQDFVNRQYADFIDISDRFPFVSEGKSVFYAGDNGGNSARAKAYAEKNNMEPIAKTDGGKILASIDTYKTFEEDRHNKLWDLASRHFAAQVKGEVKTFVAGADQKSTFRRVELPTLLKNKKVTQINGMDRQKLDQSRRQTFARLRAQGMDRRAAAQQANTTTHRKVAIAEIRQDRREAQQKKDWALRLNTRLRMEALRKQHRQEEAVKRADTTRQSQQQQRQKTHAQARREKIAELKQQKESARASNDRAKIIAARKNATETVKQLRAENQQKVRDKRQTEQRHQSQQQTPQQRRDHKRQQTPEQRYQQIYTRAEQAARKRGATPENARKAAQDRVNHVREKAALWQDRTRVRETPRKEAVDAHFAKESAFQEKRIKDLTAQAQREKGVYKGPPPKPPGLRAVETRIAARDFYGRANLAQNQKTLQRSPSEHADVSRSLEKTLSTYRERDLGTYYTARAEGHSDHHAAWLTQQPQTRAEGHSRSHSR